MLAQLSIRNFGLIDDLSIDFTGKLTILTGETGAGKSIIIDALRCVLGERINTSHIRDTKKVCFLEAIFECPRAFLETHPFLNDYFEDNEQTLIINRSVSTDGRNKIKVNNISITVSTLKEIGKVLIDFHGPHDHQLLLDPDSHITILDQMSAIKILLKTYQEIWHVYQQTLLQQKKIQESKVSRERDLDLLSHQIDELEQVSLDENHYTEARNDFARISHTEKLFENTQALLSIFENNEIGISDLISNSFAHMRTLNTIDPETTVYGELLSMLQETSDTLISKLNAYRDSLSFSEENSTEIIRKCDAYTDILRKYGPTITDALSFFTKAKEQYNLLIDIDHNDAEIQKKIATLKKELTHAADQISKKRKAAGLKLGKTIESELKELGIKHIQFDCKITHSELHALGSDTITFFISPNAGEELKPLAEIVSSGEAARVMLALKKALTKVDPIPILIFDEIDAQIGGRLGTITGKKLKELAQDRQVILITHLPQIASFADLHLKVEKTVAKGHTIVQVTPLDDTGRISELAHMLSGDQPNTIAHTHAKELLQKAETC
jgi:DNA repair protein RecN (Recombination protein N)